MSNNRNLGNIATAITNATSGQVLTSQGSGVATFADAGGGVTYYANVSDLPSSGNSNGDAAFVGANNRLYVFNGAGWYSVALLNQTPTISSVADAGSNTTPFTLSSSGTATVITITATDSEGDALTYNYSVSSGALNGSTVAKGTGASYAIASASLLSGTYATSVNAGSLTFKPDGTRIYVAMTQNDRVNQHDLSTAWDISTASYDDNFDTQSQVSKLKDIKFNNDGTKMYAADAEGTTNNTIYQYSLSTAWDVTTASYDSKSYNFSSVLTGNELGCFVFNADGSAVYLAEHTPNRKIYQFSLSTNFDISTATYSNKNLDFASEAVGRPYFQFTNDGTKLFMISTFHTSGYVGKIYEYSLTTAYDISTASYTNVNYAPSSITTGKSGLAFKPDGTKMFILGTDNSGTISQFNLPVNNTNDFIVQPHASNAATFGLTFTVNDGINTATSAAQAFTLSFLPDWSSTTQQAKLQASDAQANDKFSHSVAISSDGSTAIVGAMSEDTGGAERGAAYIFTRSGTSWSQQAKVQASAAVNYAQFGISVDISNDGNSVIIGAIYQASNKGAAYIFTRSGTTWSQQAELTASDGASVDQLGWNVSISGDGNTAIAGARRQDTGGSDTGAAYIFTKSGTTWSQEAKIQATAKTAGDEFGYTVSLSDNGNTALVTAPFEDTQYADTGCAYIFTRSGTTWSQQALIQSDDNAAYGSFGYASAISGDGDTAIVGYQKESTSGSDSGSAYIFTRSGTSWSQEAEIQSSDIQSGDYYGWSVSISNSGNVAAVGAVTEDTTASNAGSVYIFSRSGTSWTQENKIQASDAASEDQFGHSVSISNDGETLIAGAINEDTTANNAGSAYIFVSA